MTGLPALVERERQQRLAAAHAQVAFDAEVAALKLGKLQAYFDSTLAEHVVTVHPLDGAGSSGCSRSVSTFRPPELPREILVSNIKHSWEGVCQSGYPQMAPCVGG